MYVCFRCSCSSRTSWSRHRAVWRGRVNHQRRFHGRPPGRAVDGAAVEPIVRLSTPTAAARLEPRASSPTGLGMGEARSRRKHHHRVPLSQTTAALHMSEANISTLWYHIRWGTFKYAYVKCSTNIDVIVRGERVIRYAKLSDSWSLVRGTHHCFSTRNHHVEMNLLKETVHRLRVQKNVMLLKTLGQ